MKILIADSNEEFRMALAEALQPHVRLSLCCDGEEALSQLLAEHWDLCVIELSLPKLDGLTLLEMAAAQDVHPVVLATTDLLNAYVVSAITRVGISYVMQRPCRVSAVVARLQDLNRSLLTCPDPETLVNNLLLTLNFSIQRDGFSYLREAIFLYEQRPSQSVTKELYPAVAHIFGCGPKNVELSCRRAIEAAWDKRNTAIWKVYFPNADDPDAPRPSNDTFLSRMAAALRQAKKNNRQDTSLFQE